MMALVVILVLGLVFIIVGLAKLWLAFRVSRGAVPVFVNIEPGPVFQIPAHLKKSPLLPSGAIYRVAGGEFEGATYPVSKLEAYANSHFGKSTTTNVNYKKRVEALYNPKTKVIQEEIHNRLDKLIGIGALVLGMFIIFLVFKPAN